MAARRTTIPPKAQIPVAIVLGILFVFLVWFRLVLPRFSAPAAAPVAAGQSAPAPVAAIPLVAPVGQESTLFINDMIMLLAEAKATIGEGAAKETEAPPLKRNPFEMRQEGSAGDGVSRSREGSGLSQAELEIQRYEQRGYILDSLELTATLQVGRRWLAVIDGRTLAVGDRIEGFTIKDIGERSVVLEDDGGTASIPMVEGS